MDWSKYKLINVPTNSNILLKLIKKFFTKSQIKINKGKSHYITHISLRNNNDNSEDTDTDTSIFGITGPNVLNLKMALYYGRRKAQHKGTKYYDERIYLKLKKNDQN
jgi:hypothetical protein